jgi:hypothetical protein
MNDDIVTAPATGWEIRGVADLSAAMVTIQYLSSPMQRAEESHSSPNFLFHTAQLRDLAQALLRAADNLDSGPAPKGIGPKH